MRLLHLRGVAAATFLFLAGPAFAQEAPDCDMLCRLKGYLTADHMAGDQGGGAPATAPAKARHPHAAHKKTAAAVPAKPVGAAAVAPAHISAKRADPVRAAAKTPAPAPRQATAARAVPPPPVRTAAVPRAVRAHAAPPAPVKVAAAPSPAPKPTARPVAVARPMAVAKTPAAAIRPAPVRIAARAHRAASPMQDTQTASLATVIPGSAPAMQAGFH